MNETNDDLGDWVDLRVDEGELGSTGGGGLSTHQASPE